MSTLKFPILNILKQMRSTSPRRYLIFVLFKFPFECRRDHVTGPIFDSSYDHIYKTIHFCKGKGREEGRKEGRTEGRKGGREEGRKGGWEEGRRKEGNGVLPQRRAATATLCKRVRVVLWRTRASSLCRLPRCSFTPVYHYEKHATSGVAWVLHCALRLA